MTLFVLAYLAGVVTIATPCIAPILPIVLSRAAGPFRQNALPLLLGLAVAFAAVASLGALAGGWAIEANRHARTLALAVMTLFGLGLLFPTLAYRLLAPVAALGSGLASWADERAAASGRRTALLSVVLGIATGLVWAPCAGPVLALILTGAALRGPSVETSLLLLTYGLGAATSLAVGLLFGRRLAALVARHARWDDGLRRVAGAAVILGAATIWTGLDTDLLTRWSAAGTTALEQGLIDGLGPRPAGTAQAAEPRQVAALSGPLASLEGAHWLSMPPLHAEDLRGKVVLVNFWTYSCINCLRALPHVRAWDEKYRRHGLVVIGVHTPEFAFEKDPANVRRATAALGIRHAVALDNDFEIWRTFHNNAWPALYLVGADGRVRHRALGEGNYEQTERLIQRLLDESGTPASLDVVAAVGQGAQAAPDEDNLASPETYVGYQQARNFVSPGGAKPDVPAAYRAPDMPALNHWGLAGTWTVGGEFATLAEPGGKIRHRFHARDLHLVMAAPTGGPPVRFRITIDGAPPGADHGVDVDADGWGVVRESRLYQLVRQSGAVADRTFEIEFADPGVRAYAFTFG